MVINSDFIINIFAWAALLCFSGCFIPQIIKNYKIKSTRGLSDFYLLASIGAYFPLLYYVYCSDLLFVYKVMVPIECGILLFIISQKFYYDGTQNNKLFFPLFAISVVLLVLTFPLSIITPSLFGWICGWVSFGFFTLNQFPQIWKVYSSKSVDGFSFGFVSVFALATSCELVVAVTKGLPIQTLFMDLRAIGVYAIFCLFFWRYSK